MDSYAQAFVLIPPLPQSWPAVESKYTHAKVRDVMDPFSSHKRVDPHRIHISPREADLTAQAYDMDPRDLPALADEINRHIRGSGITYGADAIGLYVNTTTNPVGRWSMWHIQDAPLRVPLHLWARKQVGIAKRFWFPAYPFSVVSAYPGPTWMLSDEWHGDAGAVGHFAPDLRFGHMIDDLAARIPDHWVIPVKYI